MKFNKAIFIGRYRSQLFLFMGMVGLLAIATVKGSFAQSSQSNDGVYLPIVVSGQAQEREQAVNNQDGHDHSDHDHIGHIPEHGRFTTNDGNDMSWPPQVKYIEDIQWDSNAAQAVEGPITAAFNVASTAYADSEVRSLLGNRFTFISSNPIQEKWSDEISGQEVTYFSYSNNITIEAIVNGGEVDNITTYEASAYQPPLRKNEVEEAIKIARKYWQDQGNHRVDELQGFTIQTLKTDGDGGYYDTRMSYVSFHVDEISDPELLTWVDLTNKTVVRAAIDQGGKIDVQ